MRGDNVLHTMGFDAFGLPAEQYAVADRSAPGHHDLREHRRRSSGSCAGWVWATTQRRVFATTDKGYYRWTQWIFLQIFNSWYDHEADRARPIAELIAELTSGAREPAPGTNPFAAAVDGAVGHPAPRRWSTTTGWPTAPSRRSTGDRAWARCCPTRKSRATVAASGATSRSSASRSSQWMMRITAYADRLVDDLDGIDWPDKVRTMQRNWIGRSTGAHVAFPSPAGDIEVFTTRPDTLFGATYMVLAPEHPMVGALTAGAWPDGHHPGGPARSQRPAMSIRAYQAAAAAKTDLDRQADKREDRRVHRLVRNESRDRQADSGLHRRLRADGLRHRRDHGRAGAGRARLGVRRGLRPADRAHRETAGGVRRGGLSRRRSGHQLGLPRRPGRACGQGGDDRVAGGAGLRSGCGHLSAARLVVLSTALLGRAIPDRVRRDRIADRAAGIDAAGGVARHRRLLPEVLPTGRCRFLARAAARPADRLGHGDPRSGRRSPHLPARDEHHAELGRLVLVRVALPGSDECERAGRSVHRALLDGPERESPAGRRRSVRRRSRARRAAPAVRAVLAQGAVRPGLRVQSEPFHRLVNQGYVQAYAFTDQRGMYVPAAQVLEKVEGAEVPISTTASWSVASTGRWASR